MCVFVRECVCVTAMPLCVQQSDKEPEIRLIIWFWGEERLDLNVSWCVKCFFLGGGGDSN